MEPDSVHGDRLWRFAYVSCDESLLVVFWSGGRRALSSNFPSDVLNIEWESRLYIHIDLAKAELRDVNAATFAFGVTHGRAAACSLEPHDCPVIPSAFRRGPS